MSFQQLGFLSWSPRSSVRLFCTQFSALKELSAWTPVMMLIRSVSFVKVFLSAKARQRASVLHVPGLSGLRHILVLLTCTVTNTCELSQGTIHLCTRWHRGRPNYSLSFSHSTSSRQTTTCLQASHYTCSVTRSVDSPVHKRLLPRTTWNHAINFLHTSERSVLRLLMDCKNNRTDIEYRLFPAAAR